MSSAPRLVPLTCASLALLLALASLAPAQTIRFQTSVGAFDMLLNPTNNANLQPLVDNMVANVAAGVYHNSVVNRAVDDFVLQIGSFRTSSVSLSDVPASGWDSTPSLNPVVVDSNGDGQVDFDTTGLTNTRGTVSLALSSAGPNSGSASFFVSLNDNSFLDSQGFVPFARISDMAPIDRIMGLEKIDLSSAVGQPGSLAYTDVPLASDRDLVVIESAAVVSSSNISFVGPLQKAFGFDTIANLTRHADGSSGVLPSLNTISVSSSASGGNALATAIPEPTTLFLAMLGLAGAARRR